MNGMTATSLPARRKANNASPIRATPGRRTRIPTAAITATATTSRIGLSDTCAPLKRAAPSSVTPAAVDAARPAPIARSPHDGSSTAGEITRLPAKVSIRHG